MKIYELEIWKLVRENLKWSETEGGRPFGLWLSPDTPLALARGCIAFPCSGEISVFLTQAALNSAILPHACCSFMLPANTAHFHVLSLLCSGGVKEGIFDATPIQYNACRLLTYRWWYQSANNCNSYWNFLIGSNFQKRDNDVILNRYKR